LTVEPSPAATSAPASTTTPEPDASPTGFAFAADDVVGYYESQGYSCAPSQPSTKATGFMFRSCQAVDDAGRTLTIGIVTDPRGDLANGFASVQGAAGEDVVLPIDALDPLSGFLGAMLGEEQGSSVLEWLASHLGDAYAETTAGSLRVATYTESDTDYSKVYVELAAPAYLKAPAPSPS
jgi:hypothetical protein